MRPGERAARAAAYERARPEILEHVPGDARRVLDLGCATGPEGIFDATHLRWFTLRDARELLLQAGLEPQRVTRRGWVLWRGSRLDALAPPLLRVPVLRTLVCFQFVVSARRILAGDARN
jgi:hypothetical protein